jgi:hypothetical protein
MMKNNSVATLPKESGALLGGESLTSHFKECKDGTLLITFSIKGQWPANFYLTAIEHAAKWKSHKPGAKYYEVIAEKIDGHPTSRMHFKGAFQ